MKKIIDFIFMILFATALLVSISVTAGADDTCIFGVGANDIKPNIVFELDNGAAMEQIVWHDTFQQQVGPDDARNDYTPVVDIAWDVVDAVSSLEPPTEPVCNKTLVLMNVEEDYPFAVGAGIELSLGGDPAPGVPPTAIVVSMIRVGDRLHLEIDEVTGGVFAVGDKVQRYRNRNNIATGDIESITDPCTTDPCALPGSCPEPTEANGFFNDNGYGIVNHGGEFYLVKVLDNLLLDTYDNGLKADSGRLWTINDKAITLPAVPSSTEEPYTIYMEDPVPGDPDHEVIFQIIDNARHFRYSKNYLNWLFFYDDDDVDMGEDYDGDGTDLPTQSRFYFAKLALLAAAQTAGDQANFGIYNFVATHEGASSVQPLGEIVASVVEGSPWLNVLDPNYINNINTMNTVDYSPLAEGLGTIAGYYDSNASGIIAEEYCQDQFVIVVSAGVPSQDRTNASQYLPDNDTILFDWDNDGAGGVDDGYLLVDQTPIVIPTNYNGSTWLDDVAYYMYSHDIVGYVDGYQNVVTYTVGFMASWKSNAFLINTSNNGNGFLHLYNTTDENYIKHHYQADDPAELVVAITEAVFDIISRTTTFTAPVVPVGKTFHKNLVYLALFKPLEGNIWEGNLVKFGISTTGAIVDVAGDAATNANGSLVENTSPFWEVINWANADYDINEAGCDNPDVDVASRNKPACNYKHNSVREIYTYLGDSDLTAASNEFSLAESGVPISPDTTVGLITAARLGNPTSGVNTIISYVRGADALNTDASKIGDNRSFYTGDILHSEPIIVQYDSNTSYVFFGANDGMLHAVNDADGTEAWAFIPPDQLHRLKDMVEGTGHQFYVDSSPKAYILDVNGDGIITEGIDRVILIFGLRKGGSSYFALDVTDPTSPVFLWWISQMTDADAVALGIPEPDYTISELGESWSEPQFGRVKVSGTETHVVFIGGGFSADNSKGRGVFARLVTTGEPVWQWTVVEDVTMQYSIPSSVVVVDGPADADGKNFVAKVYVGDTGGQMWRFADFTDLVFPAVNQNINDWQGQIIFTTDTPTQKFFSPPGVTLEHGYDLIFMGTGNREDPCDQTTSDSIYVIKDDHSITTENPAFFSPLDLVDATAANPVPELDSTHNGWFIDLATGEKSLTEMTIFGGIFLFTTFTPNVDPCLPGGEAKLYALNYKTGGSYYAWTDKVIGGGISSRVVIVITKDVTEAIVSVGSTNPDPNAPSGPGIVTPVTGLDDDFRFMWWRELFG